MFILFQSLDSGSRVVTRACSFLTAAAGRRSATPASASTDTSAAPRSVISPEQHLDLTLFDPWEQVYHWSCVLPGEVWSSALPPAQGSTLTCGHEPPVLFGRSRVCGASVPHLFLAALPPVGGVFNARPPNTTAHPVWAKQWLPWQQLRSHHTHFQKGQSATGEGNWFWDWESLFTQEKHKCGKFKRVKNEKLILDSFIHTESH